MNKEYRNEFEQELTALLNKYSIENGSNTPDFILCKYIINCLKNFNVITTSREMWYNRYNRHHQLIDILDNEYDPGDI